MFFMIGVTTRRKELKFDQMIACLLCGRFGRYQVYMTYSVLFLFFIPCFRWNRRYYVTTSCCNRTYRLSAETGKKIERGEDVVIQREDLEQLMN